MKDLIPQLDAVATQVADATERTNDAARLLHVKLDAIGQLTGMIRAVANQTKLLALNASIEAARSGDDGRGFGVVASEMRALALQAEQGANDIDARPAEALEAAAGNDDAVTALSAAVAQGLNVVGQLVAAQHPDATARPETAHD
ncbi:methyl-accepting chemotaxis protein [Sphingobium chlorophenolicum]|uniref:Methyl-accepting chemotaxis receptor/sensory transducer n=1 Tax=Sphingobium chlorophenolicum TaxID=46429 RepID=A0A081R919_SPHCR|nr:methyl-accepting chemotaxis protein [Sphingobium chlorophenolicum]KEQ51692.1 Methyl-accepting chemotaxis receptor/sensory transducer [Sphingobium chlorophenolicum]